MKINCSIAFTKIGVCYIALEGYWYKGIISSNYFSKIERKPEFSCCVQAHIEYEVTLHPDSTELEVLSIRFPKTLFTGRIISFNRYSRHVEVGRYEDFIVTAFADMIGEHEFYKCFSIVKPHDTVQFLDGFFMCDAYGTWKYIDKNALSIIEGHDHRQKWICRISGNSFYFSEGSYSLAKLGCSITITSSLTPEDSFELKCRNLRTYQNGCYILTCNKVLAVESGIILETNELKMDLDTNHVVLYFDGYNLTTSVVKKLEPGLYKGKRKYYLITKDEVIFKGQGRDFSKYVKVDTILEEVEESEEKIYFFKTYKDRREWSKGTFLGKSQDGYFIHIASMTYLSESPSSVQSKIDIAVRYFSGNIQEMKCNPCLVKDQNSKIYIMCEDFKFRSLNGLYSDRIYGEEVVEGEHTIRGEIGIIGTEWYFKIMKSNGDSCWYNPFYGSTRNYVDRVADYITLRPASHWYLNATIAEVKLDLEPGFYVDDNQKFYVVTQDKRVFSSTYIMDCDFNCFQEIELKKKPKGLRLTDYYLMSENVYNINKTHGKKYFVTPLPGTDCPDEYLRLCDFRIIKPTRVDKVEGMVVLSKVIDFRVDPLVYKDENKSPWFLCPDGKFRDTRGREYDWLQGDPIKEDTNIKGEIGVSGEDWYIKVDCIWYCPYKEQMIGAVDEIVDGITVPVGGRWYDNCLFYSDETSVMSCKLGCVVSGEHLIVNVNDHWINTVTNQIVPKPCGFTIDINIQANGKIEPKTLCNNRLILESGRIIKMPFRTYVCKDLDTGFMFDVHPEIKDEKGNFYCLTGAMAGRVLDLDNYIVELDDNV